MSAHQMSRSMGYGLYHRPTFVPPTEFGRVFRELRTARDVRFMPLARAMDCSFSILSRYESGSRMPSRDMVLRIAIALDLDEHDEARLLHAAGYQPAMDETRDDVLADMARLMADRRLTGVQRDQVRARFRRDIERVRRSLGGAT